jgi:hypothetical protein
LFGTASPAWNLWNAASDACHVNYTSISRRWLGMASSMQGEKEAFFRRLDELDELALENDGEDTVTDTIIAAQHHHSHILTQQQSRAGAGDREPSSSHTRIPPAPLTKNLILPGSSSKEIMPAKISKRRSISKNVPPKLSKKPANKNSCQLQPEHAQIFRGLTFCRAAPVPLSATTPSNQHQTSCPTTILHPHEGSALRRPKSMALHGPKNGHLK